ncbi:MAG: carboxypeptidase regulatory-like domain-containing protein [Candidatus Sulfotelmatobacter sp.]
MSSEKDWKRSQNSAGRLATRWIWPCLLLIAFSMSQLSLGQNANTGELKGTVTDSSGALIAGATVTIVNIQTGIKTIVTTNGSGIYDSPSVPVGSYEMTFSKSGFRTFVRKGIALEIQTLGIDAVLQVGNISEQIVITAESPLVETETSEQHVTFDTQAVQNAPIVGGVWYNELTNVLPGVNPGGASGNGTGQDPSGQGIGINGTQGFNATWLLEGANATDIRDYNPSDNYPPVDSIQQVTVESANFGAQYGGVAALNVILKSGTNKWHGSLFEYIQNDAFDSKPYFFTSVDKVAPVRWNMFGGSVGGPIKKDKLFFFFTYQRNPSHTSQVQLYYFPTQAMRNGDFSASTFATIYDPTSCSPAPCTRSAFSGNQIPSGSIDPVAAAIQSYWPLPNYSSSQNTDNFSTVVQNPDLSQWYVGKVDYNIFSTNRLSGSINYYPIDIVNGAAVCSLYCDNASPNKNTAFQMTDTWTLSPRIVNEARVGFMRELDKYQSPSFGQNLPATIGLEPAYGANAPGNIFPSITIDGGNGTQLLGQNGTLAPGIHAVLAENHYMFSDVLTLIRGQHTVKVGGEYDKAQQNYTNWGDVSSGSFTFTGIATEQLQGCPSSCSAVSGTGIPYADFLLGDVQTWSVYDYDETGARVWTAGAFVQDDFKLRPHFTLNLGLRYGRQAGWSVVNNLFGTFDPTLVNTGQFVAPGTLGAVIYGGQDGRNTIQDGVNEWAPRIGFAWSPKERWSIRASYGIFDSPRPAETYTDGALGLGLNPHGYESAQYNSCIFCPIFQLQTGPPAGSVSYPTLSSFSNSAYNYDYVNYYPEHMPVQYYQESYFDIQHEVLPNFLVDVGYVFTKGTHLNFERDINQVPQNLLGTGAVPYSQFGPIAAALFDGYSNYNALQIHAEKRMNHGLYFMVNYAWSKTLDTGTGNGHGEGIDVWQNAYSVAANYSLSQLDAPNTFNGTVTYEIPVGTGRSLPLHGFLDEVIGGWRVTTIFQARSGVPFMPEAQNGVGQDVSGSGAVSCGCGYALYPNLVGDPSVAHPNKGEWFNPAAFAVPAANTFGDATRNLLRGPAWRNVDVSLGKTFSLREAQKLEIRADMYNAFNHPQLGQPNDNIGTSAAGTITNTTNFGGPERVVQFGAHFWF